MIGSGLKKYAQENGLKVAKGVAYGNFRGYAATMSEGSGYKQAIITTKFTQVGADDALLAELNAANIQRTYRVQNLNIAPNGIHVVFTDNPGTMKKIQAFMDWFMPMLDKYGATRWNVCDECGSEVTAGRWILINGVAHYLHEACAAKVKSEIAEADQVMREQDTGSYTTGAIGAIVGAALGAVVWAIILIAGYVASLVGLLIGWLSNKGYDLLKGKRGKGKVAILIVAVILGVVLGTLAGYGVGTWNEINTLLAEEGQESMAFAEYMDWFMLFLQDGEFIGYMVKDILLGLLFAGLGVFAMLKRTADDVSGNKVVDLE